jgi:hypothetical protein
MSRYRVTLPLSLCLHGTFSVHLLGRGLLALLALIFEGHFRLKNPLPGASAKSAKRSARHRRAFGLMRYVTFGRPGVLMLSSASQW